MKILVVGEYSSFSKNLKSGFVSLGHECIIMSWGDAFKKISHDQDDFKFDLSQYSLFGKRIKGSARIKGFFLSFNVRKKITKLKKTKKKNDIIIIVNPEFIRNKKEFWKPFPCISDLSELVKEKGQIVISLCGNDVVFDSRIAEYGKASSKSIRKRSYISKRKLKIFEELKSKINYVIPTMYSYANAYRKSDLAKGLIIAKTIPLPLDIKSITAHNTIEDKIVIFHGINREEKGTPIILEAFKKMQKQYSSEAEFVARGNMPLNEYLELMKRANIIVDQCHAYEYGMNAIYGMAMGKVVLSGNEKENMEEFERDDIPVINIQPNAEDIIEKVEYLIKRPDLVTTIGDKSRQFVEEFHECSIIAKQYIDTFNHFHR